MREDINSFNKVGEASEEEEEHLITIHRRESNAKHWDVAHNLIVDTFLNITIWPSLT